jgi:competence protein ComEC
MVFLIGIFSYNLNSKPLGNDHIVNYTGENKLSIIGTVLDKEYYPDKERYTLKIKTRKIERKNQYIRTKGLILVNIYTANCPYEYGDVLKIKGTIDRPSSKKNFGEFDYEQYLARKKIFACTNIWQGKDIQKIGEEKINLLKNISLSIKNKIENTFEKLLPSPYNFILLGMILGEKTSIPPQIKEFFIDSGVMHILAVSGLHVGIIAFALFFFLNMLKIPKKLRSIIIILILILYASITGFRPPVVRATIMFSLLVVGKLINRSKSTYISLFLAAFLILLINPLVLYDAGFLLSFTVTFFIIYLSPVFQELFSNMVTWIKNPLSISIAAWLGIFPLSAYFFNKVSLISILSNIFIIPLASIAVILGFVTFFVGLISIPIATLIANINYYILVLIAFLTKQLSSIPFSFINIAQPSIFMIFLYYMMIFFIIEIFYRKIIAAKIKVKSTIIVLAAVLIIIIVQVFYPLDNLKVNFINVGEGDCILIQAPKKYNILIDGGGTPQSSFDIGDNIVIPYLRRKGINKINLLILTHPHLDHLEGLLPILRELKVDMVLDSGFICDVPKYKEFLKIIKEKNIPYHQTKSGDNYIFSKNMEMLVLNPPYTSNIDNGSDFNNDSIVVKLYYKNANFMFTGDIERDAEKRLLSWGNILKTDILKVAHHGSSTSTTLQFLNKVDPIIAVISVGKNHFGHPAPKVIQRLKEKNVKIYRTDKNGTVIIKTDGTEYQIKTLKDNS